jgi:hypothetical protein
MDFSFTVGTPDRHHVQFHYNQALGTIRIKVDDDLIVKDLRIAEASLTKEYKFSVGEAETHDVMVSITRRRIFGGVRKQMYRVFVDGHLTEEH